MRHPASGYVQGINDLVTPFFQVFLSAYIGKLHVGVKLVCLIFINKGDRLMRYIHMGFSNLWK